MGIQHLVMVVDDVIVHVYTKSPPPQLLKEAKQGKGSPLAGTYFYRKDKPHVTPGQYHVHVYEKNNQLFAINWDGTAHDQSHGVTIPKKVYDALQTKFPSLTLPPNRIIESFNPLALGRVFKTAESIGLTIHELVEIQQTLNKEGSTEGIFVEAPFQMAFFSAQRIPFVGQPYLIVGVEYQEDGGLAAEAHLLWTADRPRPAQVHPFRYSPEAVQTEVYGDRVINLESSIAECLQWARLPVDTAILERWKADKFRWPFPQYEFKAGNLGELVRLYLNGTLTKDIRRVAKVTKLATIANRFQPLVKTRPFTEPG